MPKETTKQELVNKVNEKFYQIEQPILYNTFVGNGAGELCKELHLSMTGEEPNREHMKAYFRDEFLPKLKDIDKAEMLGNTIDYLKSEIRDYVNKIREQKKNFQRLQTLINGCDTLEKLNMLKELPLMKEDECSCNDCD